MSEVIQFNRFSELHNGKDIFFCKTDFLEEDFKEIKKTKNNVILISGNSDYSITEDLVKVAPKNISKWFCQNNNSSDLKMVTLPMGIENSFESKRSGHGVGWDFAVEKNKILSSIFTKKITGEMSNLVYANFGIGTNPDWRSKVKDACLKLDYVTHKDANLTYSEFISNVLSHEAVVCPVGNAPNGQADTHRAYEVLYSNRIPIMFSHKQEHLYETLYKFLPVVFLENLEQLFDKDYITEQIKAAKNKTNEKIKFSYWKKRIENLSLSINGS